MASICQANFFFLTFADLRTKMRLFLYVAALFRGWIVRKGILLLMYPFIAWSGEYGNLLWNCCTAVVHSVCYFEHIRQYVWGFNHCIFLCHIPFCSCSFNLVCVLLAIVCPPLRAVPLQTRKQVVSIPSSPWTMLKQMVGIAILHCYSQTMHAMQF